MRVCLGLLLGTVLIMLGAAPARAEEQEEAAMEAATAKVDFVYVYCNDVAAMRHFYVDLLGMQISDDMEGYYFCLMCGGLRFMVFAAENPVEVLEAWSDQPGWMGGVLPRVSWSVGVPPEQLDAVARRLTAAGAPTWSAVPFWAQDSYWSFPVRDPMGNTVEVYALPTERPASTTWPGTE